MTISLAEDIKSASELKKHQKEIFEQTRTSGRPVVITTNGKPDAILMDVKTFERNLKIWNLTILLAEAEEDIRKGRTRSARSFLKKFQHA